MACTVIDRAIQVRCLAFSCACFDGVQCMWYGVCVARVLVAYVGCSLRLVRGCLSVTSSSATAVLEFVKTLSLLTCGLLRGVYAWLMGQMKSTCGCLEDWRFCNTSEKLSCNADQHSGRAMMRNAPSFQSTTFTSELPDCKSHAMRTSCTFAAFLFFFFFLHCMTVYV